MFTRHFIWKYLLKPEDDGKGTPGEIKIPTLADLTKPVGAPPQENAPPKVDAPGSKPGDTPPGNAPPVEMKPEDDASEIPINVADPEVKAKTPKEFAAERKKTKETKEEAEQRQRDLESRATAAETQLAEFLREKEELAKKNGDLEQQLTTFKGETESSKKKLEEIEKQYTASFTPVVNPLEDEEFKTSHQKFISELGNNLPLRVVGATGEPVRVTFGNLIQDPVKAGQIGQVMEFYANSVEKGDQAMIDRAVNLMAGVMGADVRIENNPATDKLIASSDPTFLKIEEAMQKASPHFVTRQSRAKEVTQNAPKLAMERLTKKTETLRTNLTTGVLLSQEKAVSILSENPLDSVALFSALAAHSPVLKTQAEASIARFAPSLALVQDGLQLPLTNPTREGIAAHQASLGRHREVLADVMRKAVIGEAAGPLIAQLMRERDAAEARANAAAGNTNPGGGGKAGREDGSLKPADDKSMIPLDTVPA